MSKPPDDPEVIPLSPLRAQVARPRGARRMEQLLEADDPVGAIEALSVPDLYFTIQDVGLTDATELVAMATPDQIQGCLDIDGWQRDRIDSSALAPWLTALLTTGYDTIARTWHGLDPELRALLVQQNVEIYDHSLEEYPPEDEERPGFTTPDGFFTVVLTSNNDDEGRLYHQLIEELYRADMELARHTLMTAHSELPAHLEETSYRWRSNRMTEMGYADFYEALQVFRPIDIESVTTEGDAAMRAARTDPPTGTILPATMADSLGEGFLARVLGQVHDAASAARLQSDLIILFNMVLSASRVAPGDEKQVAETTSAAASTVSIGLEHVSAGDVDRAVTILEQIDVIRLHRLGHTLTVRLGRMARLLAPRALTAGEPSQSVLEALLLPRPQYATAVEGQADTRPFRSMVDIVRVATHLTELAARIAIADALGVDLLAMAEAPEPRPELDDHTRTALARVTLGGELDVAPLRPDELEALRRGPLHSGRFTDEVRVECARIIAALVNRHAIELADEMLSRLVNAWLDRIESELGGVSLDQPIDPRMIGGLVTSAGMA